MIEYEEVLCKIILHWNGSWSAFIFGLDVQAMTISRISFNKKGNVQGVEGKKRKRSKRAWRAFRVLRMDPREREAKEAKERQRQQLLDRAYDQVVTKQLEKLGARKTFTGECFLIPRDVVDADEFFFPAFVHNHIFTRHLTLPSLLFTPSQMQRDTSFNITTLLNRGWWRSLPSKTISRPWKGCIKKA